MEELLPIVQSVLHLQERRAVKLFIRRDVYNRYLSRLVYLPRDRYTTAVRLKMQEILRAAIGAESVDYAAHVTESVLARVHFVVRMKKGATVGDYDAEDLEQRIVDATRAWADDFNAALAQQVDEVTATRLAGVYGNAFPEAYKEDFPARVAVKDVCILDSLPTDDGLAMSLYTPFDAEGNERRFKLYRTGSALSLSQVLPHLTHMGVEVVDERPYEFRRTDGETAYIYDFGLRTAGEDHVSEELRQLFSDTFQAVWDGQAESDDFNAMVVSGGLTWRQVSIIRAYQKYLRQGGSPFSQDYIEYTFAAHVDIGRLLVSMFETSFDPSLGPADDPARTSAVGQLEKEIQAALDTVQSLDEDRILRSYLTVIKATLRTNYFQTDAQGQPPRLHLVRWSRRRSGPAGAAAGVRDLRLLAAGRGRAPAVRRGRARRAALVDRREDFRTEILGLVKAQMVKNAVIVPVGAKGGFSRQASAGPGGGPGCLARRGDPQLQDVHLRPARHHRQHRRRRGHRAGRRGAVRR